MSKRGTNKWICKPNIQRILFQFSLPKTPKQVEKELQISKLKLKPYIDMGFLKILNPKARKGRLYILTNNARKLLGIPNDGFFGCIDWDLIGNIVSSPRQKLVILKALDSVARCSENIRIRASKFNPHLSRISTKGILKELIEFGLTETEMKDRKRYYWISEKGKNILDGIKLNL